MGRAANTIEHCALVFISLASFWLFFATFPIDKSGSLKSFLPALCGAVQEGKLWDWEFTGALHLSFLHCERVASTQAYLFLSFRHTMMSKRDGESDALQHYETFFFTLDGITEVLLSIQRP